MLRFMKRSLSCSLIFTMAVTCVILIASGCDKSADVDRSATAAASPVSGSDAVATDDSPRDVNSNSTTPATADQTLSRRATAAIDRKSNGPTIEFQEKTHDFGSIWDIEEKTYRFSFTNNGDDTLVIDKELKTSCGCTAAEPDKYVFEPGESGSIGITFKPKGHGRQAKTITVNSNATNEPKITLVIQSDIKQFVKVEPYILKFDNVRTGQRHTRIVKLTSVDPTFEVLDVQSKQRNMTARLIETQSGPAPMDSAQPSEPKLIEITLDENAQWGQVFGAVSVKTRGRLPGASASVDHDVNITVNATVYNNLLPDLPYLQAGRVETGDSFEKVCRLTSRDGRPFNITNIQLSGSTVPGMTVETIALDEPGVSGYGIVLKGDSGTYVGGIRGMVNITTDMPGDETVNIRVAGIVVDPEQQNTPVTPRRISPPTQATSTPPAGPSERP